MARYDDDEDWLPPGLAEPFMWLACLISAILPTLMLAGVWGIVGGPAPKGLINGRVTPHDRRA